MAGISELSGAATHLRSGFAREPARAPVSGLASLARFRSRITMADLAEWHAGEPIPAWFEGRTSLAHALGGLGFATVGGLAAISMLTHTGRMTRLRPWICNQR